MQNCIQAQIDNWEIVLFCYHGNLSNLQMADLSEVFNVSSYSVSDL